MSVKQATEEFRLKAKLLGMSDKFMDQTIRMAARAGSFQSYEVLLQEELDKTAKGMGRLDEDTVVPFLDGIMEAALNPHKHIQSWIAQRGMGTQLDIRYKLQSDGDGTPTRKMLISDRGLGTALQGDLAKIGQRVTVLVRRRLAAKEQAVAPVATAQDPAVTQIADWPDDLLKVAVEGGLNRKRELVRCSTEKDVFTSSTVLRILHRPLSGRSAAVPPELTAISIPDEVFAAMRRPEAIAHVMQLVRKAIVEPPVATATPQATPFTALQVAGLPISTALPTAPPILAPLPPPSPASEPIDLGRFSDLEFDDEDNT